MATMNGSRVWRECWLWYAVLGLLVGLALGWELACTDQPSRPDDDGPAVQAQLHQIPGCRGAELSRSANPDSCFAYRFDQDLVVDFCVYGNCCPDSQRFALSWEIQGDTLAVAAQDTAANLCRCLCSYTIHAEFSDLALDRYVFSCKFSPNLVYTELVERGGASLP